MLRNQFRDLEEIQEEIDRLDLQEHQLELELQDVLTDVNTPEESEDEDELQPIEEPDPILQTFKTQMLLCTEMPTVQCNYLVRYQDPEYRRRGQRKMKSLRKEAKLTSLEELLSDPDFMRHLLRIRETYPEDGGRTFLNELVALHCAQNPQD